MSSRQNRDTLSPQCTDEYDSLQNFSSIFFSFLFNKEVVYLEMRGITLCTYINVHGFINCGYLGAGCSS